MTEQEFVPRICTDCEVHHVENCEKCAGFGLRRGKGSYITAAEAIRSKVKPRYDRCPMCGGTPYGHRGIA